MPIYMDRHDVPGNIHAEHVAQMHQADLKIQHLYGCKGITYWCDEERRTAFCLIEAPDEESLKQMHDHAHGDVPHRIIEVDETLVESFLGRIEDPENTSGGDLNVITESAFRILMVVSLRKMPLSGADNTITREIVRRIEDEIPKNNGRPVERNTQGVLSSFTCASDAVHAAVAVHENLTKYLKSISGHELSFTISLSAGSPVTEKEGLFEETITQGQRMCIAGENCVLITTEVRQLFENETMQDLPGSNFITTLNLTEIEFLNVLMDFTEESWNRADFKINDMSQHLGYSKSQLYRKVVALTGQSPNIFIKNYRLKKSLQLLDQGNRNIAQIAFDTGFNSPSYFSKCFQEAFGILPSAYVKEKVGAA